MRLVFERITQPEFEPVTLAEMKRHLREFDSVTSRNDDIEALITAAREWAEDFTGRALFDQTWRLSISASGNGGDDVSTYKPTHGYYCGSYDWTRVGEILLRRSPALEITSLVTVDAAGAETVIDDATYELREADSKFPRVVALTGATWSTATELRVTFRAGYADTTGSPQQDASEIPERFKQAIKLWVQANYDCDPDDMPKLLSIAEGLIRPERVVHGFA
jgi:hypothetical protein